MHFDGGFVLAELGPRKHRQTKINSRRIQGIQALIEVHAERIVYVQWPCNADQYLSEIGIDAPVSRFICIGQSGTRHTTAKPHMVELASYCLEACLDITQTFAIARPKKVRTIPTATRNSVTD